MSIFDCRDGRVLLRKIYFNLNLSKSFIYMELLNAHVAVPRAVNNPSISLAQLISKRAEL